MLLLLHILVAVSSVIYTAFVFVRPTRSKLRGSYALIALTLISGTILVVQSNAHLVQACITGITYVSIMLMGVAAVQYRLNSRETDI
jgi:hypothetical protein